MDAEELQRRRAHRARERRRRRLRRRIGGVVSLCVIVAAVVVAVSAASSGGRGTHTAADAARVGHKHRDARRGPHAKSGAGSAAAADTRHGSTAAALGPATGIPGTASVPVLMYHVIAPPPPNAPFPLLYVDPVQFAAQMRALKADGWTAVTLDQLRAYWAHGARLPPGKPIVLTFDNGYHSQYTQALPILRRLGWVADENIQLSGLPPSQGGLTSDEVRAMIDAGWELDTQGISHADLITLDAGQLHYQIDVARQRLRREYHVPVNWFCYPSGHYDATVIDAVRAAGFVGSTTVIPGWAGPSSDPFRLPRLRVVRGTSPAALLSQLASTRTSSPPPPSYGGA
ncbi:MAG: polysaccharide deacetylase family protein [Solirubrobacteraceae bacterium]